MPTRHGADKGLWRKYVYKAKDGQGDRGGGVEKGGLRMSRGNDGKVGEVGVMWRDLGLGV